MYTSKSYPCVYDSQIQCTYMYLLAASLKYLVNAAYTSVSKRLLLEPVSLKLGFSKVVSIFTLSTQDSLGLNRCRNIGMASQI